MASRGGDHCLAVLLSEQHNVVCGVEGLEGFTVSFGVSAMPEDGITREALLGAADSALYSSKRAGRNRVNGTRSHQ